MSTQPLVLVADDEPRITKLVAIALSARKASGSSPPTAARRPSKGRGDPARHRPARHRDARPRRHRGHAPAARAAARPRHPAHGQGLDGATRPRASTSGADDYIAKPFHPDELAARVRAVLRRPRASRRVRGSSPSTTWRSTSSGAWSRATASSSSSRRTEWLLLQHLAANAGKVVLHTELLTKVWGPEYRDDLQYLRVWVSRVRRKLGAAPGEPGRIKTFQGIGYLLDVEPPDGADIGRSRAAPVTKRSALIG